MSSRAARRRPTLRRGLVAAASALVVAIGVFAVAPPASAAGPWFVATNGSNLNNCTSAATPCATIAQAIAKPGFVNGDTVHVAAGTYVGQTTFAAKGANVVGAGNVVLDGNNAGALPVIAVNGSITVNLTNLTIRNGPSTIFSGGLGVVAGTVNTTDVVLRDNRGISGAGAIVAQGATLSMTGGSIVNNTATANGQLTGAGAGVYVYGKVGATPAGRLTLDGVTVSGNSALGAAQLFSGNGGGVFNAGTTVVKNSTFTGNRAVVSTSNALRSGQGGALFNGAQDSDDTPVLTIQGSTITGGLPAGAVNATSGGAVANVETSLGGTSVSGALTMTGTTLRGNQAVVGGGLYNGGTLDATGGLLENNSAYSGGGVYQSPIVLAAARPSATFDGTDFAGNTANGLNLANFGNGGAILNGEKLTVRDATFTGNRAVAATAPSALSGWGGAIFNGPLAAGDTPDLTVEDSTVDGGSVAANAVIGGGIANAGNLLAVAGGVPARLALVETTVTSNVAGAGGGVYTGGPTTITGGSLDHNSATNASAGYGGGLYAGPAPASQPAFDLTLDSVDVTDNDAAVVGGGVALLDKVTAQVLNGSKVNDNRSSISAGGVYNAGDLTVTASDVSGNDAAFQAGGIFNGSTVATDTPTLALTNTGVDDNTAAGSGGGIVTLKGATLTATNGHLNGNSAVGGGGLLVADGAPATFDGTDFVGNIASASGGGAVLNAGRLSIARSTLSGNEAVQTTGNTGLGGAIFSGSSTANAVTSLELDASTLSGNRAAAGSALITFSPGSGAKNTTSIDRSTITGNSTTSTIGAIEQFHPLTITSSTITDNTSAGGNGGLALGVPSSVGVAGTILAGNTGPECSGAVTDGGYNLTDGTGTGCGFSPARNDVVGDPQLGALADHGGPTDTRLPGPGSPALDRVPAGTSTTLTHAVFGAAVTLCADGSLDQRGIARPQGARCDLGAVEVVQVAPTVDGPAGTDVTVGSAMAPVTFTSTGTPQATLTADGLPAGLTFTDNGDGTGTLAGTPAAGTGGDHTVTVTGTNEAGSGDTTITVTVHEAPILSGPSASTYRVGEPGGPDEFTQTAGHPDATLSADGPLPDGVTFTPQPGGKGTIAGTPTPGSGGVYPVTVRGSNGTPPDATWPFVLTVEEATALTGPATATFEVGASGASEEFVGSGYPAPVLSASGLPSGLQVEGTGPGKARITGQPADGTGGQYDVTVTASNGIGADASHQVTVAVNEAPELTGPSTARFVVGTASETVFSSDGFPAASLSVEGSLPAGVTFTDNGNGTATLSGTPAPGSVGDYQLTVRASNGIDPEATLTLTLEVAPPLAITTTELPAAAIGTAYGASIEASGGLPPYEFTLQSGSLPAGLTLAPNGAVTGTPTGPTGTSTFTVRVTDSANPEASATRQVSLTVGKGDTTLDVDPVLIQVVPPAGLKIRIGVVSATLTGGSPARPIAGQTVVFKAGPGGAVTVCTGVTDANGRAECAMSAANTLITILSLQVRATYAGSPSWKPASGHAPLGGS
jgi:hypothetical protein